MLETPIAINLQCAMVYLSLISESNSDTLSCDFEEDMCGYFDTSDNQLPLVRRSDENGKFLMNLLYCRLSFVHFL